MTNIRYYKYIDPHSRKICEIYRIYPNGNWEFFNLNPHSKYHRKWQKEAQPYYIKWNSWYGQFGEFTQNCFKEISEQEAFIALL